MCSAYKHELSFAPCSCLLTLLSELAGRRVVTDASLYVLGTGVKQMFGLLTPTLDYVTKQCIRLNIILMSVLFSINCIPVPLP